MAHKRTKISAGRYEYRDQIIVSTQWDGPKGGDIRRWETAYRDEYGEIVIDGVLPFVTLREAMASIDSARRTVRL
jgi:hypothetical protein